MGKYKHVDSGERVEALNGEVTFACCDCALVHDLNITVEHGKTFVKFVRNNRKTAAMRRHHDVRPYDKQT